MRVPINVLLSSLVKISELEMTKIMLSYTGQKGWLSEMHLGGATLP